MVPLVIIANVAVEAVPHPRGIGFSLSLRYARLAPACAMASFAAAAAYAQLSARTAAPTPMLAGGLFGASILTLLLMAVLGPAGVVRAAGGAVAASAVTLGLLVPRFADHPPRVVAAVALSLLGVVEAALFVLAMRGERSVPASTDGLAFEVPRAMFDVDHKFLDLASGARIHYVDEGEGPTLFFLHGNPS
jgi:hypothetical protein